MCLSTKNSSQVLLTISDSIAISILNNDTILRGVGNELHLHNNGRGTKVLDVKLKGKIHGIEASTNPNGRIVLVFGEKEFVLLVYNGGDDFRELYRTKLSDWISAVKFLEDDTGFVVLTAHSVLLRFSYTREGNAEEKCSLVERISCVDKSTLYCATLHGENLKDLVVFGGNAFGELLIWQPSEEIAECGKKRSPLLHRLTAHNGVIFSIDYEPKENLLTTTSDDRSICFWRVNYKNRWIKADIKGIASGYGHQARVFQGKIISYEGETYVITVGEDSYFCIWRPNGELIYKKRAQFGAIIWSLAYAGHTGTIYTVGSTGNMIVYSLKNILQEKQQILPAKLTHPDPLSETEYISKVKFLTEWLLIGLTNRNRLVTNDLKCDRWKEIEAFTGSKCTVLEVYGNLIALCGYRRLTLLEHDGEILRQVYDGMVLNGVIRSFHFLNNTRYLLSDEEGNCILLEKERFKEPLSIDLPKCKERWLTSALLIAMELLLVSNRLGNVMLYQYSTKSNSFELKDVLKHPHGFLGATLLKLMQLDRDFAYVQSAGHDGTLKFLRINLTEATVIVASHRIIPVAWIETSVLVDNTEMILGFNDNHFTAWSEEHDITLQISCGGGHRCWHFNVYEDETRSQHQRIKLAFIKNKNVLLYEMPLFNQLQRRIWYPYRNRWHTKPCNVLEIVDSTERNEIIIVSAGDDNLIKVSSLNYKTSSTKLHQTAEIHSHISNIRALKIVSTNECNYLIFSGGGRAQLCVTLINFSSLTVTQLLNYTLKTVNSESQTAEMHSFDPETRIMCIEVIANSASTYTIFAACSDGFLRKLQVDNDFNVRLDKEIFYGKCLLQVRLIADLYLLTAATDGIVSFYNLELTSTYLKLPLHASGINALDIRYEPSSLKVQLLTGGDDQAVSYALICVQDFNKPTLLEEFHFPQLHTAQVTAARISKCGRYAFTSGVDQNLVHFDLQDRKLMSVIHSCVADVKGLALDKLSNLCLLYGCGLQVFGEKC